VMKSVYFMYEIEKREFLSRMFIVTEILAHINSPINITVFQHTEIQKIALYRRPGIIFLKSLPDSLYPVIKLMKKRGFKIILFQEEGIHYLTSQANTFEFSPRSYKFIDEYMAWHKDDSKFAQRMRVPVNRIHIVGNIRFELARKFNEKTERMLNNSPRLLILENFTTGNIYNNYKIRLPTHSKIESHTIFIEQQKKLKSNIKKNIELYGELYKALRREGFDFKVRKYTLGLDTFRNNIYKNEIDKNINILKSLQNNDIVIHYGSTAGLEAILNGSISIMLENSEIKNNDNRIRNVSIKFYNVPDIIDFLKKLDRLSLIGLNKKQLRKMNSEYKTNFSAYEPSKFIIKTIISAQNNIKNQKLTFYTFYVFIYNIKLWMSKFMFWIKAFYDEKFIGLSNVRVLKASKISLELIEDSLCLINLNSSTFNFRIKKNRKEVTFYIN